METQLGKRLGKTVDALTRAEVELAEQDLGFVVTVADVNFWRTIEGFHGYNVSTNIQVTGGGVEDVMTKLSKIEDATLTVVNHGRAYKLNARRCTLHVWNKDVEKLKVMKEVFGGNYYPHGSGLLWVCSKRAVLVEVWKQVKDYDTGDRLKELKEWYDETSS